MLFRSRRLGCWPAALTTTQALSRTKLPLLLVHGEADAFVPFSMMRENYEACTTPKRMLLVPGAAHGLSYVADREAYENAVREFWKDCEK